MKRFYYIVLFLTTSILVHAQTIHVANNNPGAAGGVNVFTGATALQDAHDASANGDIIYVVPGVFNYGNINITKEITVFGIGIKPEKDVGTRSLLSQVYIEASNVRVSGLTTYNQLYIGWNSPGGTNLTNITIENSIITMVIQNTSGTVAIDQLLIRNNVILNDGARSIQLLPAASNVTVLNNIIYCKSPGGSIWGNALMVSNNLFLAGGGGNALFDVDNSVFDHNIFYGISPALTNISTGNVWDNNLSFASSDDIFEVVLNSNSSNFPNLEGVDPLFVNMPINSTWNNDYDITLQGGSLALNVNGIDIGPSGGAMPFNFEGNLLPLIQSVILPAAIPAGSDLPVTIKAKGN
jgi:hypothetical protein